MSTEYSVLITVAQLPEQAPITDAQKDELLAALPGDDKWVQYPPASGRGHGFETRWWQPGDDAGTVAAHATERYLDAVGRIGLAGVVIILVHVAAPGDRLNEAVIGLDRRRMSGGAEGDWSVMIRAVPGEGAVRELPSGMLTALLERLSPESLGSARDGLVEVRFWVTADDAVDASATATAVFGAAMAELGLPGWRIVRDHAMSVAEAGRAAYRGIDRRVAHVDPATLPVAIRW